MTLGTRHLRAFDVVADTVLPAAPGPSAAWTTPGGELRLSERLTRVYEDLPHDSDRAQLRLLLGLLDSPAGGLTLFGRPGAFTRMPPQRRADMFRRMSGSRVEMTRRGAKTLKTLVALLWVTTEDADQLPPAWVEMGYPGPDGPAPSTDRSIHTESISGDTVVDADVVVVGSGAGGGVAAGVLAAAGLKVVVLEKGEYRSAPDFNHLEADAYRDMFRHAGLATTADGGMLLLAGSTLGGGTVVNYTTALQTPHDLRSSWDRTAGFGSVFTGQEFSDSLEAVTRRLGVNTDNSEPSRRDALMEEGLHRLGWHSGVLPRNAQGCTPEACGYCTMGCRIGAKMSTSSTYLEDAAGVGARFFTGAEVTAVETDRGKVSGVVARVGDNILRVTAPTVVLAAGALDTPAILLRTGLGGPAAGRNLHLHPVTAVWGRFDDRVDPWTGTLQARYSDQFGDLDGNGYGFKFETTALHPLFPPALVGWSDGEAYKRDVLGLGHTNVVGVLLRDRDAGRVTIRRDGSAVIKYRISKYDRAHARIGVHRAAELLAAQGATEVIGSGIRPVRWRTATGDLSGFVADSDAVGYGPNSTSYFSFHQMGSARMGADPGQSVVDASNRSHHTDGLYVMDASCFPDSSGVNPMLTVAAIAHRGATGLAQRLA